MFKNNLKIFIREQLTTVNLKTSVIRKKKTKGVNIFYNTKLNAISGLQTNKVFDKSWINFFLIKNRETSLRYLLDAQLQAFKNLISVKRKSMLFLKNYNSYKIIRLNLGLPIRGQRTHTNAKTARKLNKFV